GVQLAALVEAVVQVNAGEGIVRREDEANPVRRCGSVGGVSGVKARPRRPIGCARKARRERSSVRHLRRLTVPPAIAPETPLGQSAQLGRDRLRMETTDALTCVSWRLVHGPTVGTIGGQRTGGTNFTVTWPPLRFGGPIEMRPTRAS